MKTGMHSKMRNTIGDLYLTVAEEVFKLPLEKGFPTAEKKISGIVYVDDLRHSVRQAEGDDVRSGGNRHVLCVVEQVRHRRRLPELTRLKAP